MFRLFVKRDLVGVGAGITRWCRRLSRILFIYLVVMSFSERFYKENLFEILTLCHIRRFQSPPSPTSSHIYPTMAKKKTSNKKKKAIKAARSKQHQSQNATAEQKEEQLFNDPITSSTAATQPPVDPTSLLPKESLDFTSIPASGLEDWLKAHKILGLDFLVFEPISEDGGPVVSSTSDETLGPTLAHARRIYVELFYIFFVDENTKSDFSEYDRNQNESWELGIYLRCIDLAFGTVENLVQISTHRLAICTGDTVHPKGTELSTLVATRQTMADIAEFMITIRTPLSGYEPESSISTNNENNNDNKDASQNKLESPNKVFKYEPQEFEDPFSSTNSTEDLVLSLKGHNEVQALRDLLRYLQPDESKALLNTIAFDLLLDQGGSAAAKKKKRRNRVNPFSYQNLVDNCLRKSVYRDYLNNLHQSHEGKTFLQTIENIKRRDESGNPMDPAMLIDTSAIKPYNLVNALMLIDDMEFWTSLQLVKTKMGLINSFKTSLLTAESTIDYC